MARIVATAGHKRYTNLRPEDYEEELADAEAVHAPVVEFPSPGFLELCADVENLIYVVRLDGRMFVAPHYYGGIPIRHSIPAEGEDVLAAGELEAALDGSERWILNLNRESGHYRPGSEMLEEIAERLRGDGFVVLPQVIDSGEEHLGV